MPYASDAQRRFMHARHPKIARRWDAEIHDAKKAGQHAAGNAVGKALGRDDRKTLTAAGVGAGGLGLLRAGAEVEHRTRTGLENARGVLVSRQGTLAAAQAATGPGARGEPVKGTRHFLSIGQKRDQVGNLTRGVAQAERKVKARERAFAPRLRTAGRMKAGGLGVAAGGAIAGTHYFRAANRTRAAAAGY
jgi:hypothetical protein